MRGENIFAKVLKTQKQYWYYCHSLAKNFKIIVRHIFAKIQKPTLSLQLHAAAAVHGFGASKVANPGPLISADPFQFAKLHLHAGGGPSPPHPLPIRRNSAVPFPPPPPSVPSSSSVEGSRFTPPPPQLRRGRSAYGALPEKIPKH